MTSRSRVALAAAVLVLSAASTEAPRVSARQSAQSSAATRGASVTLLSDGSWLTVGGDAAPSQVTIYDPRTGTTRLGALLTVPRRNHTATVLPDGTVLIAGGVDAAGALVPTGERFDPGIRTLSQVEDPGFAPRAQHTATLLTDGRILFAGGTASDGAPGAEIWDPGQLWRPVSSAGPEPSGGPPSSIVQPALARRSGSAQLLPDGRVALSGGTAPGGAAVGLTEIFDPDSGTFVPGPAPQPPAGTAHVMAVIPADSSIDVSLDGQLALRFSEPIDPTSASASIALLGAGNVPIAARVVVAEGGMLAFVMPSDGLSPSSEFQLRVAGLRTRTGQPVVRLQSTFTTRGVTRVEPGAAGGADDWKKALASSWRQLPPLQAEAGVTALAGQVLLLDGQPLRDVTLEIDGRRVQTDRTGRFLLRLGDAASGWKEMLIDGTTANRAGDRYGLFDVAVQIVGGKTAPLPYTIWMPRIDVAHAVRIESPTRAETVITTPSIPGLELHLPPNTVITDHDGKVVREVSITAIPVDRPPFPLPAGVGVPVYFTIQPGGAYVQTSGSGPKGARIVYPNYRQDPPGTPANFWHYDPEEKGWFVYGLGAVTADGRQVAPNPGVVLYEFTGAMINGGQTPGNDGGNGPRGADPIDLSTGQFVMDKTDLVVQDVIPLVLTRTYYTGDSGNRPFGIAATHPYAMFLWSAHQYTEADLILPNGKRIHYVRTSSGTGFTDAVFEHTTSPTAFYKSTIAWNGHGWDLTLKDGTVYVFGDMAPLQAIRDRFGNTVTLTWSTILGNGSGSGNILKITSPSGRWMEFSYDGLNRITQAKDTAGRTVGYQYDAAGNLWKVTDARGGVTEYTYDIAHRMLTIKDPRNIVYLTNEYNISGRVERQTQADSGVYEMAYTTSGGQITQTEVTNPRGYVRRVSFNGDRFMTADVEAAGESVEQTTTYTRATGSNLVESVTDPLGRVMHYGYDTMGNLSSVTRLYGTTDAVTTSFTYDATFNQLTSVTDPLNHTTSVAYDSQGRLQSTTDPLNHQTTFTTNSAGQVVTATSALSKSTTLGYDLGDLVSVQTPLGHTQTRFVDAAGRVSQVTDASGSVTRFQYDNDDNVTKITDPKGADTTFTYDGNGNLLTLTDARSKTTTWTYDNMDRVATRTDPLNRQESLAYDLNGNLASWTDRTWHLTTYQHDALDRQTFIGYGTTGTPPTYDSTITTTYDAGGRATVIVDSLGGTITRTFDLLDRLTEEETPEGTLSYTYDAADRRASMTVAGQSAVSYSYDAANRLTGMTQVTASVGMAYDDLNRRTSLTLPNGIVMEYGYDDDSRLTGITYKQGASTLGALTYAYDTVGRRTSVSGSYARTGLPAALTSATYDDANQTATWGGTSFTYDDNGNLTSDGVRSYTWDARNQLASLTGPVSASFAYDALGRRREKTIGSTTTSFVYDGLNPVQELSGGSVVANLLVGLGIDEYFTRTDATGVKNYATDALGSSVALADGSGALQAQYTYEPFGGTTVTGTPSGNRLAFTGRELDETGLYYYRMRYYDSRQQRFLAEDPLGFAAGPHLSAYVGNQPTRFRDPFGLKPESGPDAGPSSRPHARPPSNRRRPSHPKGPSNPPPPAAPTSGPASGPGPGSGPANGGKPGEPPDKNCLNIAAAAFYVCIGGAAVAISPVEVGMVLLCASSGPAGFLPCIAGLHEVTSPALALYFGTMLTACTAVADHAYQRCCSQ
jgi:RHS repeat-associated protein